MIIVKEEGVTLEQKIKGNTIETFEHTRKFERPIKSNYFEGFFDRICFREDLFEPLSDEDTYWRGRIVTRTYYHKGKEVFHKVLDLSPIDYKIDISTMEIGVKYQTDPYVPRFSCPPRIESYVYQKQEDGSIDVFVIRENQDDS